MRRLNDRGQTESVGLILLVGVVVVTATAFGVTLFNSFEEEPTPLVTIEGTVNNSSVRLVNAGGETLDGDGLEVILRNDTDEIRISFGNDQFAPGDEWTTSHPFPACSRIQVYLVHHPTNAIVYEATKEVGDCRE